MTTAKEKHRRDTLARDSCTSFFALRKERDRFQQGSFSTHFEYFSNNCWLPSGAVILFLLQRKRFMKAHRTCEHSRAAVSSDLQRDGWK